VHKRLISAVKRVENKIGDVKGRIYREMECVFDKFPK
jgi:hypothetical protein